MQSQELINEIERIKSTFVGADENKMETLSGLIEQAAHERLFLKRLNEQAAKSGLVEIHPENTTMQRALPVSAEIARHSAALTNILDKLMKHLATKQEDEDEELNEFE